MRFTNFALAVLSVFSITSAYPSRRDANASGSVLSEYAQELFDFSMSINDDRWDDSYKYVWYLDNGPWSIRFTAWYIPGLLYRAQGNDIANANAALNKILAVQMNYDFESPWYGDFKLSPDEPNLTGPDGLYPEEIYATYDPNWREFIGSQLVQIVSEFEPLLEPSVVTGIETALSYAAVGEMRRNGTAPDNLILAYSNPQYMRTLVVGWIGARLNNQTFIDFANTKGTELLELFTANGSNTLGEYNCPNYYGEDVWALASNIKYGPPNATLTTNAEYILTEVWKDVAEHYNAYLGNIAGPYDRAYARDMPIHSAILGQFWCNDDFHYDAAQGSEFALLISTVESVLSNDTITKLITPFASDEERFLNKTIRDSLDTDVLRVATSWLSKDLMIGGEELAEIVNRGKQFVPAIVHWASDPTHTPFPYGGWFSLYPTASTITAIAGPNSLTITYPNATQEGSDSFQFMIGGIPPQWSLDGNSIDGFTNLPCLNVSIDAAGLEVQRTNYWENVIYNHYYYNVTYVVPENFTGIPRVSFAFEYTC